MINYDSLITELKTSRLSNWAELLPEQIAKGLCTQRYGDLPGWLKALDMLPQIDSENMEFDFKDSVSIRSTAPLETDWSNQLRSSLEQLIPWRKGPFTVFDCEIDTEWRSDWKWDRVLPHISPLKNRCVLDVGCGNGYHCLRMYDQDPRRIIGIDPSPRFVVQYYMLKHYLGDIPVDVLPVGLEALPARTEAFDTTFSMGVFYHRRSPMDHLRELKDTLKPGGELVLETLIVDGEEGYSLVPEDRYAKMNNVWFLPSVPTLLAWLKKCGFKNVRCVDVNQTSMEEQRATQWMTFQSLSDFLDPNDINKTVEGHQAPTRAVFIANKPA